jgi:hypothetical protein
MPRWRARVGGDNGGHVIDGLWVGPYDTDVLCSVIKGFVSIPRVAS